MSMIRNVSFFSQVLQQLPRNTFRGHVRDCGTEYNAKGFTSWTHLVSMLFCHLARAESLREICQGLGGMLDKLSHPGVPSAPPKSTLSYANANRTSELFEKFYYSLLDNFRDSGKLFRSREFRFDAPLKILDSTMISLIRTFVGTSKNAFEIQIWTALIALLILSWLKHRSRSGWSFSVLAAMVRFILLSNINLDDWLRDPAGKLLRSSQSDQLSLAFC